MGKAEAKRFGGILAGEQAMVKRSIGIVLCVAVVTLAFGPLGFYPVGDAHILLLLVPVALAALLFGKWRGCAVGALAGLAEMADAAFQPYDYYENIFAMPVNSVVMVALFGLLMGALFALACRLPRRRSASESGEPSSGMPRIGALVGASAAGSLFATAFLLCMNHLLTAALGITPPPGLAVQLTGMGPALGQFALGTAFIAAACVIADAVTGRLSSTARKLSMRTTFHVWLGVLTVIVFLAASALAYVAVTLNSTAYMNSSLNDHLGSLKTQLAERDGIVNTMSERGALPVDELRGFAMHAYGNIDCDLPGWSEETIALAMDDIIFTSTDQNLVGSSLSGLVSPYLSDTSYEEAFEADKAVRYYQGNGSEISYLRAIESGYERLGDTGTYQLVAIVPSSEVFLNRPLYLYLVAAVFAVMLGAIFLLTMRLLNRVVVRSVDSANEALARITAGELDQRVPDSDSAELSSLSEGINATVGALENSIAEANARIDRELAAARAIQESALPATQPPFPDIDSFDLYATMDPAREVGGDFYDYFELGEERIGFVVADVSGKGMPAALFMMAAKTAIRGAMEAKRDLAEAIGIANRSLCEGNESEMFVTAFAGVLDHRTGRLTYVNAGHNKPLVMHDGSWTWLAERSGPYLGSFDWVEYKQFETLLAPGDELFAYTDGVNEAFDADENRYGNDRLEAFLAAHSDLNPRRLLRALRTDLASWAYGAEQSDDITMLALKFGIPPESGATFSTEADIGNFGRIEEFIERQTEECGCPAKTARQILIAVEELVVNVCSYAYAEAPDDMPRPLRVHFTHRSDPNAAVIEIGDNGVPFNPLDHEDPERPTSIEDAKIGGLGLLMTRKFMDEVEYVREGRANVTIITKRW